uniref:Uncharacterized protein n=1 Tax=Arundo donax TaxID=35708 RepID=A0A0A8YX90_ARUDO
MLSFHVSRSRMICTLCMLPFLSPQLMLGLPSEYIKTDHSNLCMIRAMFFTICITCVVS